MTGTNNNIWSTNVTFLKLLAYFWTHQIRIMLDNYLMSSKSKVYQIPIIYSSSLNWFVKIKFTSLYNYSWMQYIFLAIRIVEGKTYIGLIFAWSLGTNYLYNDQQYCNQKPTRKFFKCQHYYIHYQGRTLALLHHSLVLLTCFYTF